MELNKDLVKYFKDLHQLTPITSGSKHNILKLSPGLCHSGRHKVKVNDVELEESQYRFILGSSEFKVRYGLESVSAVMILDNNIRGIVEVLVCPIGGVFQNINLATLPSTGQIADYTGVYLEEFGSIDGVESFGRPFTDIPSRATDIDGILVGRTSYPGSNDTGNIDDLEDRVTLLETTVYHNNINIPTFDVPVRAIAIIDRAKPLFQFTSSSPDVTFYYEPMHSEIEIGLNPKTGEIIYVDGISDPGVYTVAVYVMSNGVRGDMINVSLNVS